ncbi:ATP-binding protein [Allochromatium palmeri]|uniref:histidine kinase n=1 Tax=Allochromatium palmeri TaxID=231048 RepID=A0A6N8EH36_9GAMM|nr:ATP-binding protein [Allochromatium palmeri]MTW22920.1 HAMP domain-containing protein [Allochromatium palmeri]
MRLSIHSKVFLTLLLACVVVLAGSHAFVQWSFQRGLVEFADAREQERIARVVERLVDLYQREQSWRPLIEDRNFWLYALNGRRDPWREPRSERPERGPHWMRETGSNPRAWPSQSALDRIQQRERPTPLELRLMLLDAQGDILYGRPELLADTRRYPVNADGRRIGELALLPGSPVPESAELRFRATLGDRLWIIALAMLLLAAALAYPLSSRLVRPVRDFQDVARRLATGDFSARVPVRGHDELARLGQDINALSAALERNEQARQRWAADISHELRTPIALLRAELEALQDGLRPVDRDALDALHGDTLRLGRLVDDLYELTTTDMGALGYRFADSDVTEILSADVEAFAHAFRDAGLRLDFNAPLSIPAQISVDAQRLSQLFRNLLGNSLKYTDPGGALRIQLWQDAQQIIIDFQDSAPGVPLEALPRLFERLYRVEGSRNRHTGGAGLGLAIARNVVEAHGGTITADTAPQGGLWIRVTLPVSRRSA